MAILFGVLYRDAKSPVIDHVKEESQNMAQRQLSRRLPVLYRTEYRPIDSTQPTILNLTSLQQGLRGDIAAPSAKMANDRRYNIKIFVYDLPGKYNSDIVKRDPSCATSPFGSEVVIHEELMRSAFGVRTVDAEEADYFYVPLYAACLIYSDFSKFDVYRALVRSALEYVIHEQPFWNRTRGRDHIFPFVHDFGGCLSWMDNTNKVYYDELRNSIFLSHLGDLSMGCFDSYKDIVVPPLVSDPRIYKLGQGGHNVSLLSKSTFAHFRGTVTWYHHSTIKPLQIFKGYSRYYSNGVRLFLKTKYQGDSLVKIFEGKSKNYVKEVEESFFCLCPRGFAPWSRRFFDSVMLGCIPVIIADNIELPFEDVLNYRQFSVKIAEKDMGQLKEILLSISPERIRQLQLNLQKVYKFLSYQRPSEAGDAMDMILLRLERMKRPFHPTAVDAWT
eukprot:GILJ01007570.1.p1 GENE.GILJ01007570.1~~GILJ01007570.1.p1  ORF type:complete len:479 (+),score=58.75 GILJ01007570.1:104-1438(+)